MKRVHSLRVYQASMMICKFVDAQDYIYLDDIFTIDNPEFEKHIPDATLRKKVTHNISVYGQVQIIVAVTSVLCISYVFEYKE